MLTKKYRKNIKKNYTLICRVILINLAREYYFRAKYKAQSKIKENVI